MLVKFWPLPEGEIDLAELSKNGIVDVAFPGLIQGAEFDTWLLGRKDYSGIRSLLIEKKLGYESLRLGGRIAHKRKIWIIRLAFNLSFEGLFPLDWRLRLGRWKVNGRDFDEQRRRANEMCLQGDSRAGRLDVKGA